MQHKIYKIQCLCNCYLNRKCRHLPNPTKTMTKKSIRRPPYYPILFDLQRLKKQAVQIMQLTSRYKKYIKSRRYAPMAVVKRAWRAPSSRHKPLIGLSAAGRGHWLLDHVLAICIPRHCQGDIKNTFFMPFTVRKLCTESQTFIFLWCWKMLSARVIQSYRLIIS